MLRTLLIVGIGGFAGSVARYAVKLLTDKYMSYSFPYATFAVNMVGCLLIGILAGMFQRSGLSQNNWLLLATGFCGGFTTFSAFALENNMLLSDKLNLTAIIYTAASVIFGIILCRLGIYIAR